MEQKILLLEQQKRDQDNEILTLENELIEIPQELGRVRSQPPAGPSSTQQQTTNTNINESTIVQNARRQF